MPTIRTTPAARGGAMTRRPSGGASAPAPAPAADGSVLAATVERLEQELQLARRLQEVSTFVSGADGAAELYERLLHAAVDLLGSDKASIQVYDPHADVLRMLVTHGFDDDAIAFWQCVDASSGSVCGAALRDRARTVVPDVEAPGAGIAPHELGEMRRSGMRAIESTPLLSRGGRVLGMLSNHWSRPHAPAASALRAIDVLARQVADALEGAEDRQALRDLNASLEERVTERTRALRQSERRYQALVEASAQAVWTTDAEGNLSDDSSSWRAVTGQRVDDMLGEGWLAAVHPDDRERVAAAWRRSVSAKAPAEYEARVRTVRGEYRWMSIRAAPLEDGDGGLDGWVGMSTDIDDRRRAEDELRLREAEFRMLFEAAPVASAVLADDGSVVAANEAFEALTGYPAEDLARSPTEALGLWPDPPVRERLLACARGERDVVASEARLRRRNGALLDVLLSAGPVALGRTQRLVVMLADLSARLRSEQRVGEALDDLMRDTAWLANNVLEKLAALRGEPPEGPSLSLLTVRERDVLERIARGNSNREIGEELGLAPSTVRNYVSGLYEKLEVHSRAEAVVWARNRGLGAGR